MEASRMKCNVLEERDYPELRFKQSSQVAYRDQAARATKPQQYQDYVSIH